MVIGWIHHDRVRKLFKCIFRRIASIIKLNHRGALLVVVSYRLISEVGLYWYATYYISCILDINYDSALFLR